MPTQILVSIALSVLYLSSRSVSPNTAVLRAVTAPLQLSKDHSGLALDSIYALVRRLDEEVTRHEDGAEVYADTTDMETTPSGWIKLSRRQEDAQDYYSLANVWQDARKETFVGLTLSSPSGDWAHYLKYYYSSDGTLACVRGELRTFYGNVIIARKQYYDHGGKLLMKSERFLDLDTRKPLKRRPLNYQNEPIPQYLTRRKLPFAHLLKK